MASKTRLCPACEMNVLKQPFALNAYSRYARSWICTSCGTREAFTGFFWREQAVIKKIKIKDMEHDKV